MRGRRLVAAAILAAILVVGVFPGRARASTSDITNGLIIGGAITGAVAVVLVIAILVEGNKEPEFEQLVPGKHPAAETGGVKFRCRPVDGTLPLMCW